ncbi:cAMP-dependent protein kinase subunit [Perkinsus olseni]|uniref:cAMP-dependent protein kinase subunit n=1 Tax=Perkinsus olseni TaxID=32597 RepID=A0A7J6PWP8_PEROL|nr:cAMP-dependent protein kinase subunit [Perkinsus olseni]
MVVLFRSGEDLVSNFWSTLPTFGIAVGRVRENLASLNEAIVNSISTPQGWERDVAGLVLVVAARNGIPDIGNACCDRTPWSFKSVADNDRACQGALTPTTVASPVRHRDRKDLAILKADTDGDRRRVLVYCDYEGEASPRFLALNRAGREEEIILRSKLKYHKHRLTRRTGVEGKLLFELVWYYFLAYSLLVLLTTLTFALSSSSQPGVRICADGGSNRLYDQFRGQLVPDVIIGDFDSVRPEVIQSFQSSKFGEPLRVIKCSDECNTDLDKCMLYAAYHYNHHPDEYSGGDDEAPPLVAVAGSINYGGRLDHTFSIINSLLTATRGTSKESAGAYAMRLPNKFRPILLDPDCLAMFQVLPAGDHSLQLGCPNCLRPERRYYAGVLPVEAPVRSCTTEGLRWNCEDYRLEFGGIISSCNQISETTEMLRIVNSDPVLFTMTLMAEEASSQPSSPVGDVGSSGPMEGFKSFYTSVTGRDEVQLPKPLPE